MKRIVCFGDSNTWGYIPSKGTRYEKEIRWPGVLQAALGDGYEVLEAGISGLTTRWDNIFDPALNGSKVLDPVLLMHTPIDLVIMMLGTNDLKEQTAWASTQGALTLVNRIRERADLFTDGKARVLWVAPPLVCDAHTIMSGDPTSCVTEAETKKFAGYYTKYATFCQIPWFNAADVAHPLAEGEQGEGVVGDGVHLPPSGHRALGLALAEEAKKLLA